jgi:hypothetical protein
MRRFDAVVLKARNNAADATGALAVVFAGSVASLLFFFLRGSGGRANSLECMLLV